MRFRRLHRRLTWQSAVFATLLTALPAPLLSADLAVVERGKRQLLNEREVGNEVAVAAGTETAVKAYFLSFRDYQDLMLFHPKFGYYSSGTVSFVGDWTTYAVVLEPYFGQMITEQIFRMWAGMRHAGTLAADEPFTIAEFGAGDGSLAESILDYIAQRSTMARDKRWGDFAGQAVYASYDRSPALSATQRQRNARFGKRFEARVGDATDPTSTITPGSLKGVVLSNEMLDNFSVHKVILSPGGSAEVAFVVPWLAREVWRELGEPLPANVKELVARDNQAIQSTFTSSASGPKIYLSRAAFIAVLESLAALPDFASKVRTIRFDEIYIPATAVPELGEHIRRYTRPYTYELAKAGKGFVAYINLGESPFIQGAGRILKAGYVMTIDYGDNWNGITTLGPYGKLRTYGPGSSQEKPDPYQWPTQNDITSDVNFSYLAQEGQLAGLRPVYFGFQRALQSATHVSLDVLPSGRRFTDSQEKLFKRKAVYFRMLHSFKLLVQQKEKTDASYAYPDGHPLPLQVDKQGFAPLQR
jgi:SAM-dependent MidA family methyltransferase